MNKIFTFLIGILFLTGTNVFSQGQDTLLFEAFNDAPVHIINDLPDGNDTTWINFDFDGHADGSPGSRPGQWYWSVAFSDSDFYLPNGVDTNGVFASNSWLAVLQRNDNWLITPPIWIADANAVLSWKSAPYQTPRYLDGYVVLASTTSNFEDQFTDTLFVAAENTIIPTSFPDSTFARFGFSNGFVHGEDGTYIEYDTDSTRFRGVLRPFSESLAQYSGQRIYIAFVHNSFDDNLISIDDILVMGTETDLSAKAKTPSIGFDVHPNPVSDRLNVNVILPSATPLMVEVRDITGKLIDSFAKGVFMTGEHQFSYDARTLANGTYFITLSTPNGNTSKKFIVNK
jgi:hypothetical protein